MTGRAPLCGHSQGIVVKDGTNCLHQSQGRHSLGSSGGNALWLVRFTKDPNLLKKTFEFNRPATTTEAASYLFGTGCFADAVAPLGSSRTRKFALLTRDMDVVM